MIVGAVLVHSANHALGFFVRETFGLHDPINAVFFGRE